MDAPRTCTVIFLLAALVDIFTEFVRDGVLNELLYAGDLVLMSETIEGLRNKFFKWKDTIESNGLKVMVSGSITQDGMSKRKVDPCGV